MATYVRYRGLVTSSNSATVVGRSGVRLPSALGKNYPAGAKAVRTTAMSGADNDITVTAKYGGTWAHSVYIALLDPSTSSTARSLAVAFSGKTITFNVTLAVDGSSVIASTETATSVVATLNADPLFSKLATAAVKTGDAGTGVVTALSAVALASGTDVGESEDLPIVATSSVDVVVDIEDRDVQKFLRRNSYRLVSLGAV